MDEPQQTEGLYFSWQRPTWTSQFGDPGGPAVKTPGDSSYYEGAHAQETSILSFAAAPNSTGSHDERFHYGPHDSSPEANGVPPHGNWPYGFDPSTVLAVPIGPANLTLDPRMSPQMFLWHRDQMNPGGPDGAHVVDPSLKPSADVNDPGAIHWFDAFRQNPTNDFPPSVLDRINKDFRTMPWRPPLMQTYPEGDIPQSPNDFWLEEGFDIGV